MMEEWTSPDDKVFKRLLVPGEGGRKPYEGSTVKVNIIDCSEALKSFNDKILIIGDNDGELGRMLDICITTMRLREKATFTITIDLEQIFATIELVELEFKGYIFQWNAKKKYEMALMHKEKGVEFFNKKNQVEAAYRFVKGLKILSSIPVDVGHPSRAIDNVEVGDIKALKGNLFNNLSSCYFREQVYDMVIPLCKKVLTFGGNNVKALYKLGVAYEADRDFERAQKALSKALKLEPQNKACVEHLQNVKQNLREADVRVSDMMKKMIVGPVSK